jgi:hypothetical protein
MAKGDWLYKKMSLIGPNFVPSRQTTRQLRRKNAKERDGQHRQNLFEQGYTALCDRVHERRKVHPPVEWPAWWKKHPTGPV